MKKIIATFMLALSIILISVTSFATEGETETQVETTDEVIIQEIKDEKIKVKAKVVQAGKSYLKEEAEGIQRTLQDVTIEVKEGKYKGQKLETVYVMTYDVDNKIVGPELTKGNTVIVQISTEQGEITEVTIQEIVRQNYIIIMIFVFFAIILLVGKRQ